MICRWTVKLVVFLIFISTVCCVSLKTIPSENLNQLQTSRKFLKIHSDDSLWVINQYHVNGIFLSGKIVKNPTAIPVLKSADIYIPSSKAIKIEGDILSLSTENIGKVDYQVADGLLIIESISIFFVLLLFVSAISS